MKEIFDINQIYSTTRRLFKSTLQEINSILAQANQSEDKFQTTFLLPEGENRQGEGGLRTKGYFKVGGIIPQNDPLHAVDNCSENISSPLITVVTVVYNGEAFLEDTILSVINQTYDNVEYIIIDGGSTDGTLDIIRKYEHAIDYWVSENDKGIYDAMNKGIFLSTGKWINFMNGGDAFYKVEVLDELFSFKELDFFDIVYGNHQVLYPSGRTRIGKAGQLSDLWKGSQFCHQAAFVKVKYQKENRFNINTRIVADFEFFYMARKSRARFHFVNDTIARFEAGGLSDVKRVDSILGFWILVDKSFKVNAYYLIRILMEEMKSCIKRIYG
ncbi:Colanic acid biosynthesis glycosyl transferase WcaE [Vibrio cholerae]|nr:putative glycosyltransferase [Vibrio cholerae]BCN18778.1 putative glycosyltransferase [Vibrio cholerae]GHY43010.1 Colanic acid biosynthesis glycosyl transferase WcaE [Vibrio cholerae]GHZ12789.1 Colanic acid biosynthesis glycosyl transferase WcaE [Vibrio cholerae]